MKTLGEARVILPAPGNSDVVHRFERDLREYFGGFTRTTGTGSWLDEGSDCRETVFIYDVAIPPDRAGELLFLALRAAKAMKQKALYFKKPDSQVTIVEVT